MKIISTYRTPNNRQRSGRVFCSDERIGICRFAAHGYATRTIARMKIDVTQRLNVLILAFGVMSICNLLQTVSYRPALMSTSSEAGRRDIQTGGLSAFQETRMAGKRLFTHTQRHNNLQKHIMLISRSYSIRGCPSNSASERKTPYGR